MTERWCVIAEHPSYIVSDAGRVRHRRVGAPILRCGLDRDGYRRVTIERRTVRIHRLVCEAFHGPHPANTEVAHLDGNKLNNSAANLVWATRSENTKHQIAHGTYKKPPHVRGERHPSSKLTAEQVSEFRERHAAGVSGRKLAREVGMTSANMSRLLRGETWSHIPRKGCAHSPSEVL